MNLNGLKRLAALVVLTMVLEPMAMASDGPPSISRGAAPPEAVAACKGQREGAAVEFPTPNGETIHGVCKQLGGTLAAVPAGDIDDSGGPPAEAVSACKDQQEGTTVEFTIPSGEKVKGSCKEIEGRMVAVPEVGPGGERKGGRPPRHDNE